MLKKSKTSSVSSSHPGKKPVPDGRLPATRRSSRISVTMRMTTAETDAEEDTARYIADMVASLAMIARQAKLDLLTYLLDMARVEAEMQARQRRRQHASDESCAAGADQRPRGRRPGAQCGPRFPAPEGSGGFPRPNSRWRGRDRPPRPAPARAGARLSRSARRLPPPRLAHRSGRQRSRPNSPAQAPSRIPPKAARRKAPVRARTTGRSGRRRARRAAR